MEDILDKPLEGLVVLDFSQFLSGPSAGLRLSDLGARVIKVEHYETGDICRSLYVSDTEIDGDSTIFHAINRNKESISVNLKDRRDFERIVGFIREADVMIQNFRPGVMQKLGLHYEAVRQWNPRLIYAEVTGYGTSGPWRTKPGQDLLVQSLSGLARLNGDDGQPPMPFGLSVADMMAGAHLVNGILAALVRRGIHGCGAHVEVSLLEAVLDLQFEVLTTYLNDGNREPKRSAINNANAYLGAPYGIYRTKDGYLALAMNSLPKLGELLDCEPLRHVSDADAYRKRDEIKRILADHLLGRTTEEWLRVLEPAGVWCTEVLTWDRLMRHEAFQRLDMVQEVRLQSGRTLLTTRCPIRIDGRLLKSAKGAPRLGEDNERIFREGIGITRAEIG
jgi:crotonobetainyl-CoA:carnitine CoA-transferase CaiB-like acyl-CoA transferase